MRTPFVDSISRISRPGRRALATSALTLTMATGAMIGPTMAQDGTGAATPTPPSACEVIPATATPGESAASPVASVMASPVATETASPIASGMTDLTGTPSATTSGATPVAGDDDVTASDSLTTDLDVTATAIAGCLTDGDFETLAAITGDLYRGQLIGFDAELDTADFTALSTTLPDIPYQILSIEEATFTVDDTATAMVTYEMAHQVRKGMWEFSLQDVEDTSVWVLESETAMVPDLPANTTTLDVMIKDGAYTVQDDEVSGPSVAIKATNTDKAEHELLVLRFEGDTTPKTLLQSPGPALPEGVAFIGQLTIPVDSAGTLLLSGLQPGTYTIVDMFPNAEGLPNLVDGMQTTLTVK